MARLLHELVVSELPCGSLAASELNSGSEGVINVAHAHIYARDCGLTRLSDALAREADFGAVDLFILLAKHAEECLLALGA